MDKSLLSRISLIKLVSLLMLFLFYSNESFAEKVEKSNETKKSAASKVAEPGKTNTNVLDFDADIIEGERVAPSLFVQMDLGAPKLDTLMFQRKSFNDFHAIDMKRKPKYRIKGK